MGNSITLFAGFALASQGGIDWGLFLATFFGSCLIIASACVVNNYIDKEHDKKMERTKNRVLALGIISEKKVLLFALILGVMGVSFLIFYTNWMALSAALLGFVVYVSLYSFLKYRSVHATLIGSIAGAMPPVIGYLAVKESIGLELLLLFLMIVIWQMPHFFSIAIYRLEDYAAAAIPVLPLKRGIFATKVQMVGYILFFMGISCLLPLFGGVGYKYLFAAGFLGMAWLFLCLRGFKVSSDKRWARQMFSFSLIVVTALCLLIPF